jgi:formylglycine-generating enzyme required for sulfatase activity
MKGKYLIPVFLIGSLVLLLVVVRGEIPLQAAHKLSLYACGSQAANLGNWPAAFSKFRTLYELNPGYRDVGERMAEALDRSVACIPAGEFGMGSVDGRADERPLRRVYLDSFEIDRYEVTNGQYQRFLLETGRKAPQYWQGLDYPAGQADYPVAGVGWQDAKAYCEWVGKRLPTEAEWEKACRGPLEYVFPWGNAWDYGKANNGYDQVEYWPLSLEEGWQLLKYTAAESEFPSLQPVGSYPDGVSGYGVHDLAGNLSEWVADWYNWDGYRDLPSTNPVGMGPPWNHSVRGSGWYDRRGQEDGITDASRCAARNSSHSYDDPRIGFRCARPVPSSCLQHGDSQGFNIDK